LKQQLAHRYAGVVARRRSTCILFILVTTTLGLAVGPTRAGLPFQADPVVEAKIDSLVRTAVDHAFAGRLDEGLRTIDLAHQIAPRDPRIGLTRFRLLRENYPTGMFEKERARAGEPALLDQLDHTIAICDSTLELDEDNAAAYLYRGWAYMNKAQTHLIARRMRAAAGASRRAKSDLDTFYEYRPEGDPDAATVLGAYLYYADTLPGFFKFLRWLIRVPGGDRERGLELVRDGAAGDGYTSQDARLILAVTYFLFDGNLEDGRRMLLDAAKQYPRHPWVVVYSCALAFLYPGMTGRAIVSETAVLDGWDVTTRGWGEPTRYRMIWSRSRLYRQFGRYDDALADMNQVVEDSPPLPHWVRASTHLMAIELAGNLGRAGDVERLCGSVPDDEAYESVLESVEKACGRVSGEREADVFAELGKVRTVLYSGYVERAARLLERVTDKYGGNIRSRFLEAEVARERGLYFDALDAYADVEAMAKEAGNVPMRTDALVRMGEIYLNLHDYKRAAQSYEKAKKIEPNETMFANIIQARLRYIDRRTD
jgi:tetratricopeptide (TPR) repeat protein